MAFIKPTTYSDGTDTAQANCYYALSLWRVQWDGSVYAEMSCWATQKGMLANESPNFSFTRVFSDLPVDGLTRTAIIDRWKKQDGWSDCVDYIVSTGVLP